MIAPILVIAGSVRNQRIAPQVANWVATVGRETTACDYEVVDLAQWPLPMDDEPAIPNTGDYRFEHSRAWSRKIAGSPAFVFVTPQYNGGYPAALKNAIDHLYKEWAGKPAMIVTYGGHGGARCGEQLDQVCRFVRMKPISIRPALSLPHEIVVANLGEIDPGSVFETHLQKLRQAFDELDAALQTE